MFDIIGFWGTVSAITISMLTPILVWLLPLLARHLVVAITGSHDKALEVYRSITRWGLDRDGEAWGNTDYVRLFNRVMVHEVFVVITGAVGGILWVVLTLASLEGQSTLVGTVADVSVGVAPYMGEVTLAAILYFSFIWVGRRAYKTYLKVDSLVKKANEQSE
jgi:hypothetical protein